MNFWNFGAIFGDFSEARDLFVNIFQTRGVWLKNNGLRVNFGKPEGLSAKWWGFFWFRNYFQYENDGGPGPWLMDHCGAWSMVDRPPWPATELDGARRGGHSGARWLCRQKGKWRGRRGSAGGLLTGAWTTARRRRAGGGTPARSGDDVGSIERRRG
jgi:hypothetical protein